MTYKEICENKTIDELNKTIDILTQWLDEANRRTKIWSIVWDYLQND